MKTYSAKPHEIERRWFVIDAEGQVLGRLASRVATVLRGKHKPVFTPHTDVGDFVVVVNAEKVRLTGNKLDDKLYRRHSGYPGGLREIPYRRLLETFPERAIERAVKGMLPKGTLGRQQLRKLKVYRGSDHPHSSQKPEVLEAAGPIPVYAEPVPPRPKREPRPPKAKAAEAEPETESKATKRKASTRKPKAKVSEPKAKAPKPKDEATKPKEPEAEAATGEQEKEA